MVGDLEERLRRLAAAENERENLPVFELTHAGPARNYLLTAFGESLVDACGIVVASGERLTITS